MFYSKYSRYTEEQMLIPKYLELCEYLLNLAKDETTREKMKRNIV